jgi:hypothetical protein
MAGKLTSVMFDSLVQRFERMADGISRHKQEDGFSKIDLAYGADYPGVDVERWKRSQIRRHHLTPNRG